MSSKEEIYNWQNKSLEDIFGEVWKPVYKWESGYLISNFSRIKTTGRQLTKKDGKVTKYPPIILSVAIDTSGYPSVHLQINTVGKTKTLHTILAESFIDKDYRKKGLVVNHLDGNKLNCSLDNIEITTPSKNIFHAYNNGLNKNKGENHYSATLTDKDIAHMRELYSQGVPYKELSSLFKTSYDCVLNIVKFKRRILNNTFNQKTIQP